MVNNQLQILQYFGLYLHIQTKNTTQSLGMSSLQFRSRQI
jgi:hypothetical protein